MNVTAIAAYSRRVVSIARHPSNRGHWLDLSKRILALRWSLLAKQPVEFKFLNRTRIRCWPDTDASRALAYYRIPDYAQMEFMLAFLRPGDDILDVGANIGLYTVLAGSLVSPTGSVDAVEAVPATARRLRENVALNLLDDRVRLHQLAVGSDADWVEMTATREATNYIVPEVEDAADRAGATVRVQVRRLDSLASRPSYVFGKIDVEGCEWDAFRGAVGLLAARTPPVWMVEVNGSLFRYGHAVEPFVSWMAEHGFDAWMYEPSSNVLRRIHQDVWGDILFIARDRLEFIRKRISDLSLVE